MAATEVVSQNVVGYQEFGADSTETFLLTCPTFASIGSDGKIATFGDITVSSSFKPRNDKLIAYQNGSKTDEFTYVTAAFATQYSQIFPTISEGWHNAKDFTSGTFTNLNSEELPTGCAFAFSRTSTASTLTYKGEVVNTDVSVTTDETFVLLGNCFPVDMTFGDIVVNSSFKPRNDKLIAYQNGSKIDEFTYVTAAFATQNSQRFPTISEGWHNAKDFTSGTFTNLNSKELPAGCAIAFSRTSTASVPTFKNPINK